MLQSNIILYIISCCPLNSITAFPLKTLSFRFPFCFDILGYVLVVLLLHWWHNLNALATIWARFIWFGYKF